MALFLKSHHREHEVYDNISKNQCLIEALLRLLVIEEESASRGHRESRCFYENMFGAETTFFRKVCCGKLVRVSVLTVTGPSTKPF